MPELWPYGYDAFRRDITLIETRLNTLAETTKVKADIICAPSRGGLVPGVFLSHHLGIPFHPIVWDKKSRIPDFTIPKALDAGQRVLIVEDIIDSGETMGALLKDWDYTLHGKLDPSQVHVASLIHNTDIVELYKNDIGAFEPGISGTRISRSEGFTQWVEFFWEQRITNSGRGIFEN